LIWIKSGWAADHCQSGRRLQASPAIIDSGNTGFVEIHAVPKFTRYGPVRLVQCLAVVRISAASHFITASEPHFLEPIGIRKRLTRHTNDVSLAVPQDFFSLFKG